MKSSDFRNEARKNLNGNWSKVTTITLSYLFISIVFSLIGIIIPEELRSFFSLALFVFEVPLSFGFLLSLFKIYIGEDSKPFDFFSLGFDKFSKAWTTYFHILLKILLPLILSGLSIFLVAFGMVFAAMSTLFNYSNPVIATSTITFLIIALIGVILYATFTIWLITKSYYYYLSYIILADKPDISSKEAVTLSKNLMKGHRGKLFCLHFSFIGWSILSILSLGIGFIWLIPYMQFAQFSFFKSLSTSEEFDSPINSN